MIASRTYDFVWGLLCFLVLILHDGALAFSSPSSSSHTSIINNKIATTSTSTNSITALSHHASGDAAATATTEDNALTESEQNVQAFFEKLHNSGHPFRVIVVGSTGGILETTHALGPTFKLTVMPKTGKKLLTMASDDQSFEFHVNVSLVAKLALVQRETPKKTMMRVMRLTNSEDESVATLILAEKEKEEEAAAFFDSLKEEYGDSFEF